MSNTGETNKGPAFKAVVAAVAYRILVDCEDRGNETHGPVSNSEELAALVMAYTALVTAGITTNILDPAKT